MPWTFIIVAKSFKEKTETNLFEIYDIFDMIFILLITTEIWYNSHRKKIINLIYYSNWGKKVVWYNNLQRGGGEFFFKFLNVRMIVSKGLKYAGSNGV